MSVDHPTILYIADPMCSWCWGFSPVMEQIRSTYQNQVTCRLLLGGLRPANTERFDATKRDYILRHWHAVHTRTGQPFNFTFHMASDFTYNTEPPSRAVATVRNLQPSHEFGFLQSLHQAFYVQNRDITKLDELVNIASESHIDAEQFKTYFLSPEAKKQIWQEFDHCRQLGIEGFPSLVGQAGDQFTTLTYGYQSMETLGPLLDDWLNKESKKTDTIPY